MVIGFNYNGQPLRYVVVVVTVYTVWLYFWCISDCVVAVN